MVKPIKTVTTAQHTHTHTKTKSIKNTLIVRMSCNRFIFYFLPFWIYPSAMEQTIFQNNRLNVRTIFSCRGNEAALTKVTISALNILSISQQPWHVWILNLFFFLLSCFVSGINLIQINTAPKRKLFTFAWPKLIKETKWFYHRHSSFEIILLWWIFFFQWFNFLRSKYFLLVFSNFFFS